MSLVKQVTTKISIDEYLDGELLSEIKHEYIDGEVYAMAVASTKHNLISSNILSDIKSQLKQKQSACDVFSSDMKVKISDAATRFFYPDVMVTCSDKTSDDSYYQTSPIIIVEVLSKTTRKNDFTTKMISYFSIHSLEEYVLIEQDFCQVQVYRKNEHWKATTYFLGDEITFNSIGITITVEDIYYHVNNEEMLNFLKEDKTG